MKKPTSKSTPKTVSTASSRKPAAGPQAKKGSWVRRHPIVTLGTVAAGVGAYALLRSKGSKKSTSRKSKRKAGPRAL